MSTQTLETHDGLRGRIGRFFFADEAPYGLALLRILLPLVLLIPMVPRWFHARELYSTDGAAAPLWFSYGYANVIPELPGALAVAFHTALLFCLLTAAAGWRTRTSLGAAVVLYTWLNLLDSVSTITKYSVIASHVLLLLTLSHCGAVWSVDAWLRNRRRAARGEALLEPRFPAWPRRLVQLLIGIVYFGAAITKINTPTFLSGDQMLFWMITNLNFGHSLGEYLTLYPSVLVVSAYATIVWEILFVFLAWRGFGRAAMIGLGIVFHLTTLLTLGLIVFPLLCISIYACFLNEEDVRRLRSKLAGFGFAFAPRSAIVNGREASGEAAAGLPAFPSSGLPRLVSPPWLAFIASLVLVCAAGVGAEHWRDPYGKRRPEGAHTLRELDPDYVRMLLAPSAPIRDQDKLFSFNLGTVTVGGRLLNRRDRFRPGETVIAQAALTPPHEDMWFDCHVRDADGRVIHRMGQVALRENHVVDFHYPLPESLEPGEYAFVLVSRQKDLAHRRFTLQPATRGAAAN